MPTPCSNPHHHRTHLLQGHDLVQRGDLARVGVDALHEDEAPVQGPAQPAVLGRDALEHGLQVLHVVVPKGDHARPGKVAPVLHGIAGGLGGGG